MPKTITEYAKWLAERNLRWPTPPKPQPVHAAPFTKPIAGLKGVAWDVYGTLLRIADGELIFQHPQAIRMEVALDKTLQEFNLWNSMSRKPGAPWEYLQTLYTRAYDDLRLAGSGRKGDLTEIDSAKLWRRVLSKMELEKYTYDESLYGDLDELCEKIAYFFHASLQGIEASPGALDALKLTSQGGFVQGLVADGQCFTLTQVLRALEAQGTLPPIGQVLDPSVMTLSYLEGARKPSKSLYQRAAERFRLRGIEPGQVLFVSARLREDLAVAKSVGFRTALYAGDKISLKASVADLKDPTVKPDRLLTELGQVRDILSL
ncbi:MAG: HAD hydrolase-like protein [Planctomycetaceae bacterium]|nr:HAD hydrolase-like protein [Planctomycetaceae bacterium]